MTIRAPRCLAGTVVALAPAPLLAHEGRALQPHDVWSAWTWDPAQLALLLITAALYAVGFRVLRNRTKRPGAGISTPEAAAFALGWLALAIALISPVHAMGEVLLTAHMAQHELLMAVAAPLLVLGRPLVPALWAVPQNVRRAAGTLSRYSPVQQAWTWLTKPAPATGIHAIALWAWHVPALYNASLRSEGVHALQHASFFGTALLFWWAVLGRRARRNHAGVGVFALFVTMMHTGALGALLAVANTPWYPAYIRTTTAWGLTAVEDQQLAGLVMWVPAGLSYIAAALWLFSGWLTESGRRTSAREARAALDASGAPLHSTHSAP